MPLPSGCSLLPRSASGGCDAKIGPGALSSLLDGLPPPQDARLLVGYAGSDDAAVYQIDDEQSFVMTVDFLPPMVDDARAFGRIAAANALSDIYAMGGRPLTALNILCFPQTMDMRVLREVLAGGAEKIREAGAVMAGGHSIYDQEAKYGLAVTGLVRNDSIMRNNTPRPGDRLILTKPLGVGIIMAAHRAGAADPDAMRQAAESMQRLNLYAAEKMRDFAVSACTDITGFGLLAHALEMAADKRSIVFYPRRLPYFAEAYAYAADGHITVASRRNRAHLEGKARVDTLPFPLQELIFDPQTSGGLLISVAARQADELLAAIRRDDPQAALVGEISWRKDDVIIMSDQ
ncbi:MAG: selenide, water dikinase SelD [Gracilibacteraceae bacterium]|nr:selenide, water dikinase SelD [Gracilibacteraceae bacterium]